MKSIALFFGGNSMEHNVSLKSAYCIAKELEFSNLYCLYYIGILENNIMIFSNNIDNIIHYDENINKIKIKKDNDIVYQIGNSKINNNVIDIAFLATHGGNTEDGNLQGFLTINNIKHTGSNIIGSVLCMNKNLTKDICRNLSIPVIDDYVLHIKDIINNDKISEIIKKLGSQLIIKINNGGSSMGIFFCNENNLMSNIIKAFQLCDIILIEKIVKCREILIGIIGKDYFDLLISDVGEYIKNDFFLDYENKYNSKEKLIHSIDIEIPIEIKNKITKYSTVLFKKLFIKNYARFDFFLTENNKLYLNEINTLPGINKNSLFITLWKNKNMSYFDVLNKIIESSI